MWPVGVVLGRATSNALRIARTRASTLSTIPPRQGAPPSLRHDRYTRIDPVPGVRSQVLFRLRSVPRHSIRGTPQQKQGPERGQRAALSGTRYQRRPLGPLNRGMSPRPSHPLARTGPLSGSPVAERNEVDRSGRRLSSSHPGLNRVNGPTDALSRIGELRWLCVLRERMRLPREHRRKHRFKASDEWRRDRANETRRTA